MSYILTAIHTADGGDAAADYAAALAEAAGLPLRVIHAYTVPVALGEMPMPLVPISEVRDAAAARLANTVAGIQSRHPSLMITSEASYGMMADLLGDECERNPPLLTIVGSDKEDEEGGWMGSATTDLLREGAGPVLAVSAKSFFSRPQRVCLACDARSIREGIPVAALLRLQGLLGFQITVLHVTAGGEDAATFSGSALEGALTGISASYAEVSGEGEVDAAIAAFADAHGMDWLALAPHHYGFWAGLFHKSHTSRVLHLAHVPVLALHG